MSNKKILKLIGAIAALGTTSFSSVGAYDSAEAAPKDALRNADSYVKGTGGNFNTGNVHKGTAFLTNDGRALKSTGGKIDVYKLTKGQNGQVDLGNLLNASADNEAVTYLPDSYFSDNAGSLTATPHADAIDALGTEILVDKDLYLRTKEGKFITSLAKKDGQWQHSQKPFECTPGSIKITPEVIKTQPDNKKMCLEYTFEHHQAEKLNLFAKTDQGKVYLANAKGKFCDWLGTEVPDAKKVEVAPKYSNYLEVKDIKGELSFRYDQGKTASAKGFRKVDSKELVLVAVMVKVKDEADGGKMKSCKFFYSPSDGLYLSAAGTYVNKSELTINDAITDANLKVWHMNGVAASDVKTTGNIWWKYNVHDKTWKMGTVYGSMAGLGTGIAGLGAYGVWRMLGRSNSAPNLRSGNLTNPTQRPSGAF